MVAFRVEGRVGKVRRFYNSLVAKRDWVLAKIGYLQAESDKWKLFFTTVKLGRFLNPYHVLRKIGFSPQWAIGALALGGGVGGYGAVEVINSERSFNKGDPGIYLAPDDAPIFYSEKNNTLKVDLATTTVGSMTIENLTLGTAFPGSTLPSGEVSPIVIGGSATLGTYLIIGHLKVNRWKCDTFLLSETDVHTLNIRYNASDGQSIGPIPGIPRNLGVGGGNRAGPMNMPGGTFDQVRIGTLINGVNGKIDELTLSNFDTKGGSCILTRIKAGTIDIEFMETGVDNNFATKDFVIAPSVIWKTGIIGDNFEVSFP